MDRYDYREAEASFCEGRESERGALTERLRAAVERYAGAHEVVYRPERRDYFFDAALPALKQFAFINSAVLDIEELDNAILASLTCGLIGISPGDADFMRVFEHADQVTVTASGEGLPVLTLYFSFSECVGSAV